MFKEFKEFLSHGNSFDLALGVVIGGAFQKIVNSLVNDIIMPTISLIFGKVDFSHLAITVGDITISYGSFISNIFNFFIIGLFIFFIVKYLNKLNKKIEKFEKATEKNMEKLQKKMKIKKPKHDEKAVSAPVPTTKICPYCFSEVNIKATKCPNCTSDLK